MTISRVSSDISLYTSQTQPGDIVPIWYLANGDKTYLIRNNDKLEYYFVNDENSGQPQQITVPNPLILEEVIEKLPEWAAKHKNTTRFIHTEKCFPDILFGANAFYIQPEYLEITKQDFSSTKPLPVSYTWNTDHKIIRIAKQILPIIGCSIGLSFIGKVSLNKILLNFFPPIGVYKFLHFLVGKIILIASSPMLIGISKKNIDKARSNLSLKSEWKYKRITIEVDDYKIDSVIVGRSSTLSNGRWTLVSNGNGQFYEGTLYNDNFKQILHKTHSNAIMFNYPGVGASSGLPNKQAMIKVYRAILTFLEDKEKGIGAKEIIGHGFSLGGGIQGESLKTHPLKKDIKYIFIKDRTFSSLSQLVSLITCRLFGFLIKPLGWEMDSVTSSKTLQAPEIILQRTNQVNFHKLENSDDLAETDDVIKKRGSLAFELLKLGAHKNKYLLGITSNHNESLDPASIDLLSEIVNKAFSSDLNL